METGAKIKIDDLFAYAFVVLFKLPVLAGYGEHWELSKEESKQLGTTLRNCLETIPEERKKRIMRKVEKYTPWIALVAFGGIMTYQRITITRMILAQQKQHPTRFGMRPPMSPPAPSPAPVPQPVNEENTTDEGTTPATHVGNAGRQPGGTFSGGKSLPLPFRVPE